MSVAQDRDTVRRVAIEPSGPNEVASESTIAARRVSVGGKPFSSRNPTPIGAIGLVVIICAAVGGVQRRLAAAHRRRHDLLRATSARTRTCARRRGAHRRRQGRHGRDSTGSTTTGSRSRSRSRTRSSAPSTLAIKIKTLLGAKYLAIDSIGTKEQDPSNTIPLSRTTSPFDVYPAFTELTNKINSINTDQLAKAFTTLATTFRNTPASVRNVLHGPQPALGHDRLARRGAAHAARAREPGHRRARRPRHRAAEDLQRRRPAARRAATRAATRSTRCWSTRRRCRSSSRGWCTTTRRRSARCSTSWTRS